MQRLIAQAQDGDAHAAAELLSRLRRLGAFEPAVEAVRAYVFQQMHGMPQRNVEEAHKTIKIFVDVFRLLGDDTGADWLCACHSVVERAMAEWSGASVVDAVEIEWRSSDLPEFHPPHFAGESVLQGLDEELGAAFDFDSPVETSAHTNEFQSGDFDIIPLDEEP